MKWPHQVRIERPGDAAGSQDPDSGAWTPGPDGQRVLYDGDGDLQHKTRQIRKDADRDVTVISDADLFLRDETDLWTLKTDDRVYIVDLEAFVEITAKLVDIDHLSGRILIADLNVVPMTRVTSGDASIRSTGDGEDRTT